MSMPEDVAYSVVVPVYGNRDTLPELVARLETIQGKLDRALEVVFVIDGSPDDSYAVLRDLLDDGNLRAQLITHSRNFGSYAAIRTGLGAARGDYVAVMAADLQEPPELTLDFFAQLSSGDYDIGVGARTGRDDPTRSSVMSRTFWRGYRRFVMPDIPNGGVDIFACTRQVAAQLTAMHESHTSMVAQLFWLGYRRVEVPYQRLARTTGRSGWSLRHRVKYMFDSIFAFTNLPITMLVVIGSLGLVGSVIAATGVFVVWAAGGISVPGYTALMLVTLLIGSSLLTGLGVVGSYVWRTYENSKERPFAISRSHEVFAATDSARLRGDGHGPTR